MDISSWEGHLPRTGSLTRRGVGVEDFASGTQLLPSNLAICIWVYGA
jgi:hypothetical protein